MRGLYMAEGAMLTQQVRMELIGNNLANQQTPGYKRDDGIQTSFAEWLLYARNIVPGNEGSARTGRLQERTSMPVGTMPHNVAIDESYTLMRNGNLQQTGRSLDFALMGNGFFQVQAGDRILNTRNGHFFLNADGYLVNAEGHMVLGENGFIRLVQDGSVILDRDLFVSEDGSIFVDGGLVDQLRMVAFDPEANYTKVGENYFLPVDTDAELDVRVFHRFLESSNVDLVKEMVTLMEIKRNFESAQRVMITYDGILDKAANELGSLR